MLLVLWAILDLDLVDLGVTCDYGPKTMNFFSKWWAFLLWKFFLFISGNIVICIPIQKRRCAASFEEIKQIHDFKL